MHMGSARHELMTNKVNPVINSHFPHLQHKQQKITIIPIQSMFVSIYTPHFTGGTPLPPPPPPLIIHLHLLQQP